MKKKLFTKIVKFIISIIALGAVVYGVYKDPSLITNKQTQETIIEKSEDVDTAIDNLFNTIEDDGL